jgi:hypothetical protein
MKAICGHQIDVIGAGGIDDGAAINLTRRERFLTQYANALPRGGFGIWAMHVVGKTDIHSVDRSTGKSFLVLTYKDRLDSYRCGPVPGGFWASPDTKATSLEFSAC